VLPKGIYNLSVFANGDVTHRFATASIALLNERKNFTRQKGIRVFPNPATSNFSVAFELTAPDMPEISIYDISGKLVLNKALGLLPDGSNEIAINTYGLAKGTYILQLNGKHLHEQKKLCLF
jgi:hypothetical protein